MRRHSLVAVVTVLALTPARSGAQTDYCALIAPADAAAVLRVPTTTRDGDKAPTAPPGSPEKLQSCTFTAPGAIPKTLRVSFTIASSPEVATRAFQGENQAFGTGKRVNVSDLGDEAALYPDGEMIGFRKHAVFVFIQGGADPLKYSDTSDRLRALAAKVAAKLP